MLSRFRRLRLAIAITFFFVASGSPLFGYALEGPSWPFGSTVNVRLAFTGPGSGHLQDGFTTFNASAADALALWNQQIQLIRFGWTTSSIGGSQRDGLNTAFFSSTVYGQTYGQAIAVTVYFYSGETMHEADNLFNSALLWDSYRGPLQYNARKGQYVYDFHRVAIHEFGHTLGLAHPDDNGQTVTAIMNRHISDLDHYVADDIAGMVFLYGAKITSPLNPPSIPPGSSFNYQITTNFSATSYSASGLPAGLQIYPLRGLISGAPTESGTFRVIVTANGAFHPASATLVISVNGAVITSSPNPAAVDIGGEFSYQITATGSPTTYSALALPPGLVLNAATGLISGVPNLSGTYHTTITAHTPFGNATAVVTIVVAALPVFDVPVATFKIGNGPLAADPVRARLYVGDFDRIVIVDTQSLAIVGTLNVGFSLAGDMSVSADGNVLWFTRQNATTGRIDLVNLINLPDLPANDSIGYLRETLDHRLYAADFYRGGIVQLDPSTGALLANFDTKSPNPSAPNYCTLEMSPDFKTLYVGQNPASPGIHKWDISGASPVFIQGVNQAGDLGEIGLSHDGKLLCFWTGDPNLTNVFATADIAQPLGQIDNQGMNSGKAVFSRDDSLIFQVGSSFGTHIVVFDAASRQLKRIVTLPPNVQASFLAVDSSDTYFFAGAGSGSLVAYRTRPEMAQEAAPKSLSNVSTRALVGTDDKIEVGGFIVKGSLPKEVVVRAIAPSLVAFGVNNAMMDPMLELHDSTGAIIAANDNWNSHRQEVLDSGKAPQDEHEAVIVATLQPGSYTAVLRGLKNTTGLALFELYDIDPAHSKIANISTRGNVGIGENVMIGGFIVGGDQPTNVIVRALGPTLTDFGVAGALADPTLELHDGNGTIIAQNDNWKSRQQTDIQNSGYAPPKDAEAAILATLQPGNYTAIVRGKGNTTGVALVEIYNLDAN